MPSTLCGAARRKRQADRRAVADAATFAEPRPFRTQSDESSMSNVASLASAALTATDGILRLAPCWVPRSFLHPGRRLKLHPDDYYAFGMSRGGIDERWFGSTVEAANDNREEDEGLSYCVHDGEKFLLRDAVEEFKGELVGDAIWDKYGKWPVFAKFFDNMGPIPHHMHQNADQAALVGQEGKPESYYFPPQLNAVGNNFPHTFMGFEPGVTKQDVIDCLQRWNEGDNGILDLSKAYRLKPGTGWLIPPGVLHAPGSLLTYEPQWGSDVFAMFQNLVEGRAVSRKLLVKDFPEDKHEDLDYMVEALDWDKNVDPHFRDTNYLEPVVDTEDEQHTDKWVVYGKCDNGSGPAEQLFTAKELTVHPGGSVTITDGAAFSWITVQGGGTIGGGSGDGVTLQTPAMIRFGQMTEDEVFVTAKRAGDGVTVTNTGQDTLVGLRYFGPEAQPKAPENGAWKE